MGKLILHLFILFLAAALGAVLVRTFYEGVKEKDKDYIMVGLIGGVPVIFTFVVILWTLIGNTHICPKCKHLSFDERYCVECGEQLVYEAQRCPKCNEVADDNATYCYNCGEKLGGQNE